MGVATVAIGPSLRFVFETVVGPPAAPAPPPPPPAPHPLGALGPRARTRARGYALRARFQFQLVFDQSEQARRQHPV